MAWVGVLAGSTVYPSSSSIMVAIFRMACSSSTSRTRPSVAGLADCSLVVFAVLAALMDFPDDAMLDELQIESPFELTGLYDGIPLTERSVMDQPLHPDTIWLFRRPILDEWITRGDVAQPVAPAGALELDAPSSAGVDQGD